MEELLNKLIQRWWKPFGIEWIKEFHLKAYECERWTNKIMIKHFDWYFTDGIRTSDHPWDIWARMYVVYWLKHITAKDSWLWQFVCENHLYIYKMWENKNFIQDHFKNEYNECCYQYLWDKSCYEYYLLESALCNEEDLEKFLLDNIKIS